MPPKKGGKKKGGKAKKGKLWTTDDRVGPLGHRAGDLCLTPLGATCEVLGVKYDGDPTTEEGRATARLWLRWPSGYEGPTEPGLSAEGLVEAGYVRAPESAHLLRAADAWRERQRILEEKWEGYETALRLRADALAATGFAPHCLELEITESALA